MKKKFLAVVMAATMTLASAFTAFAAPADVDCTGWWAAHSEAIEVTTDGVKATFKSTTYADATLNWDSPIYVLYSADDAFAGGAGISDTAGYAEYFVMRSDLYGWSGAAIDASLATKNTNDAEYADLIVKEGVPADDAAWTAWLEANKAGVDVTVTAKLDGNNAVITIENNGVKSTATIPVDTSKKVYISLGGELCKLTNINVEPLTPAGNGAGDGDGDGNGGNVQTGDVATVLPVVLLAGAAVAVVVLKKRAIA